MNWIETELSKIAAWGSGGTPSRSNPEYYGGSIPWIKTGELGQRVVLGTEEKITELGLKNSSAKIFPKGSVAVAMYGATIGKTSILGIDASTNQACGIGIPFEGVTTSEYLYYYLTSQKEAFIEAGKGGAQPNISQAVIKTWPFPLAPLPEQKRIAKKLDTVLARVDVCRERLNRVPLILKRFRQSVLAAAISGQLTSDWREYNQTQVPINLLSLTKMKLSDVENDEKYFLAATSWIWTRLGNVVSLINGDRGKNYPNQAEYVESGIPFINTGHIEPNGSLSLDRMNYITREKFNSLGSGKIKPNDLVYCLRGATMGKTAFVTPFVEGAIASSLVIVRPGDRVLSKYAYFFLLSPQGKDLILRFDNGTAQPNLSAGNLALYPIAIPTLQEQHEIVRRVETLFAFADRLEARLATARTATDRLTSALLAKAFRGELVPQDPNDEPAAELLKRLATTRNATNDKPRRARATKVEKRPSDHPSPVCES